MSSLQKPVRILMLHGYTQSGPLFHSKTRALEKELHKSLPPNVELIYPTAPVFLRTSDIPGYPNSIENPSEEGQWFAWSRWNEGLQEYTEFDQAWKFLSDFLDDQGPFDGVIGFSQGGAFAAALASLLEPTRTQKPKQFSTNHPPFKFAVSYSGFKFYNPGRYGYFYEPRIQTPVLHFIGSLDTVVTEERSIQLVEYCGDGKVEGNPLVIRHPGGHYLPSGKNYLIILINFIKKIIQGEPVEARGNDKKVQVDGEKDEWEDMPF